MRRYVVWAQINPKDLYFPITPITGSFTSRPVAEEWASKLDVNDWNIQRIEDEETER